MRVLITRPRHQSEKLLQALEARGYTADLLPLLEIVPLEFSETDKESILGTLSSADKIISVSANASELLQPLLAKLSKSDKAFFAIGPATAKILESVSCSVQIPETDYNSESLLALPEFEEIENQRIVLLCGKGGRDYLELMLAKSGAKVERIELYTRKALKPEQVDLASLGKPDVLTAMSGDTAKALADSLDNSGFPDWKTIPIIVPGDRVAEIAFESGFTKVLAALKPTTESLLDALVELEQAV